MAPSRPGGARELAAAGGGSGAGASVSVMPAPPPRSPVADKAPGAAAFPGGVGDPGGDSGGDYGPVDFAHARRAAIGMQTDALAQDLVIRGRYAMDRQTESALREAIASFEQATARAPRLAGAYAGLADAYNMLAQFGYIAPARRHGKGPRGRAEIAGDRSAAGRRSRGAGRDH